MSIPTPSFFKIRATIILLLFFLVCFLVGFVKNTFADYCIVEKGTVSRHGPYNLPQQVYSKVIWNKCNCGITISGPTSMIEETQNYGNPAGYLYRSNFNIYKYRDDGTLISTSSAHLDALLEAFDFIAEGDCELQCPSGQEVCNNTCYPPCPEGQTRDENCQCGNPCLDKKGQYAGNFHSQISSYYDSPDYICSNGCQVVAGGGISLMGACHVAGYDPNTLCFYIIDGIYNGEVCSTSPGSGNSSGTPDDNSPEQSEPGSEKPDPTPAPPDQTPEPGSPDNPNDPSDQKLGDIKKELGKLIQQNNDRAVQLQNIIDNTNWIGDNVKTLANTADSINKNLSDISDDIALGVSRGVRDGLAGIEQGLDEGFGELGDGLDEGFGELGSKLDSIDDGIDELNEELDEISDGEYAGYEIPDPYESEEHDFAERTSEFLSDMRSTSIFSVPNKLSNSIPGGGSPVVIIETGSTFGGTHTVDFSYLGNGLNILKYIFHIAGMIIAIRIITLKR